MISSLDNKKVKDLTRLHQKKYRQDHFLVLEEEQVRLAKDTGYLETLVYAGEKPFDYDQQLEVTPEVLAKIAGREDLSYLGVSRLIEESDDYGRRVLILDQLQDPLNIGRIMEAAQLFGFDSLILSQNCADIYNEKCLKVCQGGIYRLNIVHREIIDEIKKLQRSGYIVYATGLRGETRELHDARSADKMAFVLGNEGSGVRSSVMDACDQIMKIDMCNIDSLNVAMAASIIMYRFRI